MSNSLVAAFVRARRGVARVARGALPQTCELCVAAAEDDLVCRECESALPANRVACPVCAIPMASPSICGACIARSPAFASTLAPYVYAFPVDRLIGRFKYGSRLALAEWCARAIVAAVRAHARERPDVIVAVPLARERQRERGHNHALEIARRVARELQVPLDARALTRVRGGPPQAALAWDARAKNVRGAFACTDAFEGTRVAVVDDVMTTGASLAEIARVLRRAGATHVENWIVARTPSPADSRGPA